MTQLNKEPWDLAQFTIPQLMCLMSDSPRKQERITNFSQWREVLEKQEKEEKEWLGKG